MWSTLGLASLLVAAACAGTSPEIEATRGGDGDSPDGTGEGATGGSSGGGGRGGGGVDDGIAPGCGAAAPVLPAAFETCRSCHSSIRGTKIGNFPSLFDFSGDAAAFEAVLRAGRRAMPAFEQSKVSREDAVALHRYFTTAGAGDPTCDAPVKTGACATPRETISPLFAPATTQPAGFEVLPSGALRTFAAGRVRGRHENEGEFSKFHERYFEERSYGFVIDDTITAGGSTVTVTWLPEHRNTGPNIRAFYTGDGNVFHINAIMNEEPLADGKFKYTFTINRNARENRALKQGDLLELEFGVFLVAPVEGRTNYYTDMFRYRVGEPGLHTLSKPDAPALSGGAGTPTPIVAEPELSYEQLSLNLQAPSVRAFLAGRRIFHTTFDNGEHAQRLGPAIPALANILGPTFNAPSCTSCHVRDGRGAPPANTNDALSSVVIKVTGEGEGATGAPTPHPYLGRQIQTASSAGVPVEGSARVAYTDVRGTFADGSAYTLASPKYTFTGVSTASDAAIAHYSPRVARQVVGMGLLEAVDEAEILRRADADDCDADGVSGRPNVVVDPASGGLRLGRFGWKAGKASVPHQVADALLLDSGVTTSLFPKEECAPKQTECAARVRTSGPEMPNDRFDELVAYVRTLGVPARRKTTDATVLRGEAAFTAAGCPSCHAPTLRTGKDHPVTELRAQVIHPYSDLLLHDMGEGLADTGKEYRADSREWRTAPLWGVGLVETVNGHTRFLHDGRARSLLEAVLWHGGEAEAAKQRVVALPAADRAALEAFLKSL